MYWRTLALTSLFFEEYSSKTLGMILVKQLLGACDVGNEGEYAFVAGFGEYSVGVIDELEQASVADIFFAFGFEFGVECFGHEADNVACFDGNLASEVEQLCECIPVFVGVGATS